MLPTPSAIVTPLQNTSKRLSFVQRVLFIVAAMACFAIFSAGAVGGVFFPDIVSLPITLVCILGMFTLALMSLFTSGNSDHVKARQTNETLGLASRTISYMIKGLDHASAQPVCELLLPHVSSISVAITGREQILGFAGEDAKNHLVGTPIQTQVTRDVLEDGKMRIVDSAEAIGFARKNSRIKAAIIVALTMNHSIVGTLKFYYSSPRRIDETQKAMAEGFATLLSAQLTLSVVEQQTELATRMELKALQAQINPHFLFNTINTIASYTRTDPERGRDMLREFAVYYRRLLENSEDLIALEAEVEQTQRYLMFQRARFGEDAILMEVDIEDGLESLKVPAFVVQPIVENAVAHARRDDGSPLHIGVRAYREEGGVAVAVRDDGVGIPAERLHTVVGGGSKTGMGIALKNVNARLQGYFGGASGLCVESVEGEGTTVKLTLSEAGER